MSSSPNPPSPKLWAGGIGGTIGTIVSAFVLWLVGAAIINRWDADAVDNAIAAVPAPLAYLVLLVVGVGSAMAGVWLKKDPERLPTLGDEQRRRVGLQNVDTRKRG